MNFFEDFKEIETKYYYDNYDNIFDVYSKIYLNSHTNTVIIIDYNLSDKKYTERFSYREYTNHQNLLMHKHEYVYRFNHEELENNLNDIQLIITQNFELPVTAKKKVNRENIDASFLEHFFEKIFFELYGNESYDRLTKEEGIIGFFGENIFADYVIEKEMEKIIIEENGERYHHPVLTGFEKYSKQLWRQNALVYQGYKVYRFSTEEIKFKEKIVEEMKFFFGEKDEFCKNNLIEEKRKFKLYDHQENSLYFLNETRKIGNNSAVVVLPTGTGKTLIAIEDIKNYIIEKPNKDILIVVPSRALKFQWIEKFKEETTNINVSESFAQSGICVVTQNKFIREKNSLESERFGYIVIDEAHHSVANGISKAIKHFRPDFLLGITATPDRLDRKKLEEVFSTVETKLTLKDAIKNNICSPIRIFRLESNIDLSEVRFNGKDYISGDLEKRIVVSSRNGLIADTVKKYFGTEIENLGSKQGLIFCVNLKHAEQMSKLLNERGISSRAVSGSDNNSSKYIEEYLNGEIRFLCSCQLLSEGWDAPATSIIVMARPTISKVVYFQQLGRGTRLYKDKEALYVIDVVDNYSYNSVPWSANAAFNIPNYRPFGDLFSQFIPSIGELLNIDHLLEREKNLIEIDIDTFESKYGDLIDSEEVARELFLNTETLKSWIKKGSITPDYILTVGKSVQYKFKPERIEEIRILKNLKKRDNNTIKEDFWEFVNDRDYSLSYKIIFILSLLKNIDKEGEGDFEKIANTYIEYYKKRIEDSLAVDRKTCPYTLEFLANKKELIRNILTNPFEKYERKRFIYHCTDLKKIGFSFYLWEKLDKNDIIKLKNQMLEDLNNYYTELGGAGNIEMF